MAVIRNLKGKFLSVSHLNKIKLGSLKGTRIFYNKKLKDKRLTEKQRDSYLTALGSINRIIEVEENSHLKLPKGRKKVK